MSVAEKVLPPESTYILITGTNSGLGLATCCRLIDEFLDSRPSCCRLVLILTTRDSKKGHATEAILRRHLTRHRQLRPFRPISTTRILFRLENLELTSLLSVRRLSQRLLRSAIPRLDAVILNASVFGAVGLNWPLATWTVMTDVVEASTWPTYKLSAVGLISEPQLPPSHQDKEVGPQSDNEDNDNEPILGEVFCANVFGHYMLAHWLMPLLRACPETRPGRIIWLSSITGDRHHFNPDDIQALESHDPYEHTKRMTDLMALTSSRQPATAESLSSFISYNTNSQRDDDGKNNKNHTSPQARLPANPSIPSIHIAHPGICATSIFPLPFILQALMTLVFYLARLLGSPWHTISAYTGASAPCWLALALDPAEIGDHEQRGPAKWGSAISRLGKQSVQKTDTPGWGICGDGEVVDWWSGGWGRKRDRVDDPDKGEVANFVEEGALVWKELERLRRKWEGRIEGYLRREQEGGLSTT